MPSMRELGGKKGEEEILIAFWYKLLTNHPVPSSKTQDTIKVFKHGWHSSWLLSHAFFTASLKAVLHTKYVKYPHVNPSHSKLYSTVHRSQLTNLFACMSLYRFLKSCKNLAMIITAFRASEATRIASCTTGIP